jgi:hypothetical protein
MFVASSLSTSAILLDIHNATYEHFTNLDHILRHYNGNNAHSNYKCISPFMKSDPSIVRGLSGNRVKI